MWPWPPPLPSAFLACPVPKWCKLIVAVLLLPVLLGAAEALWRVILATGSAETFWIAGLCGAACWLVVLWLLPRPMLLYVFGHELTHALWTWLCGGRVQRFKASARGGHVVISRTNFLIVLAPYFFPLYVALVVGVFATGSHLWDWRAALPFFYLAVGAAYAFHVTLTWHILETDQSDVTSQGYLFSAVVILLGNVLVLLLGLPWLTDRVDLGTALRWWLEGARDAARHLWNLTRGTGA